MLLRLVRRRPGMYFGRSELRFDQLVAFITGLDIGSGQLVLDGFREFLILRQGVESSFGWWSLVLKDCFGEFALPLTPEQEAVGIEAVFDLLDEFLAEVHGPRARARLHQEYLLWKEDCDPINLELTRFSSSPPAPTLTLTEAANALGTDADDVLDLIATDVLPSYRRGAQVLLRTHDVRELAERRRSR
ncbi:helix-turn-helix domain-containing protein [Longispora urticae]